MCCVRSPRTRGTDLSLAAVPWAPRRCAPRKGTGVPRQRALQEPRTPFVRSRISFFIWPDVRQHFQLSFRRAVVFGHRHRSDGPRGPRGVRGISLCQSLNTEYTKRAEN